MQCSSTQKKNTGVLFVVFVFHWWKLNHHRSSSNVNNSLNHDELRIALNDILCFLLPNTEPGNDTKPAVVLIISMNPLLSGPCWRRKIFVARISSNLHCICCTNVSRNVSVLSCSTFISAAPTDAHPLWKHFSVILFSVCLHCHLHDLITCLLRKEGS